MKKFYPCLLISFISSFLFVSSVSATTYNYTIPSYITNLTQENYNTMFNTISNTSLQYTNVITIMSIQYTSPQFRVRVGTGITYNSNGTFKITNCRLYDFSNDFSTLTASSRNFNCSSDSYNMYADTSVYSNYFLIYSNTNLVFPNNDYITNYTFIDRVFTMPTSNDMRFYSVYDMFQVYHTDPYPILTTFFNLVIEKLELICEFFTSSYIYLSVFVVFMFYFIVMFLRRLI